MPKLDIASLSPRTGSDYPTPFADLVGKRLRKTRGAAAGLSDFGVNLTELPPGCWSSQRHWHSEEDECLFVLSGELMLVTAAGEERLVAGDFAAFPKNAPDGHHVINRSAAGATYLEIGSRSASDICSYPDIDMLGDANGHYVHLDGTPYPA